MSPHVLETRKLRGGQVDLCRATVGWWLRAGFEHKRQKPTNICGQTAAVSPGPSLCGESNWQTRGAAEGSEDSGGGVGGGRGACRTPGSVSFPRLARAGQLWPWLSLNRWAEIQHSFQISQAAKTAFLPSVS